MYSIRSLFGSIINENTLNIFADATVSHCNLDSDNRKLCVSLECGSFVGSNAILSLREEIKTALKLTDITLDCKFDPLCFSADAARDIAHELCAKSVVLNGFFNSADFSFEENTVIINLKYGGYKRICESKFSEHLHRAISEKFGINKGDTVTFKEPYGNKEYSFKVEDIHYYPAGLAVFMDKEYLNTTFDYEEGYYNGYFSNTELTDIDENLIATKITVDDLTKTSRQMETSMGSLMDLLSLFGIVMFMLIIYLLSKIIIEKNAHSISMTKILGYSDKEISGLYILSTSIVTIGTIILTIPIVNFLMEYLCIAMLSEYPGWLPYYVPFTAYIEMALAGIIAYAVIAFIQYRKVKKAPLDIALRTVE